MERLPEILGGMPAAEVERLQLNIAQHWRRFTYTSYPFFGALAKQVMEHNFLLPDGNDTSLPGRERELRDFAQGDAVQSLMEWLHGRMTAGV